MTGLEKSILKIGRKHDVIHISRIGSAGLYKTHDGEKIIK